VLHAYIWSDFACKNHVAYMSTYRGMNFYIFISIGAGELLIYVHSDFLYIKTVVIVIFRSEKGCTYTDFSSYNDFYKQNAPNICI